LSQGREKGEEIGINHRTRIGGERGTPFGEEKEFASF